MTSPGLPAVCVVGSLHLDLMVAAPRLPGQGETLLGDRWWWKPGGKGANQAMAAARHGAAVRMVGRTGDDDLGGRLRAALADAGVDATHVRIVDRPSGMSVAIQDGGGDYAAVVVSGANRMLDAAAVADGAAAIRDAAVLALQLEVPEAANVAAASLAREAGTLVILNAAPAAPLAGLVGIVDVLVVNAVEAAQLGAAAVTDLESAVTAARALRSLAAAVVVTAGGAGLAAVWDAGPAGADEEVTVAAHPVASVAAHGAGDVLVGALAARLAATRVRPATTRVRPATTAADAQPFAAALRYANAAAALHVSAAADDPAATGPAAVLRLLRGSGAG